MKHCGTCAKKPGCTQQPENGGGCREWGLRTELILDASTPGSFVDEEIRRLGLDPEELERKGAEFYKKAAELAGKT